MIGIDTNILVRYLTRDDEAQFLLAQQLIRNQISAGERIFIGLLVILETEWVLRSRHKAPKQQIARIFNDLLETRESVFEDEETLEEALHFWKDSNADFADCMIVAKTRRMGCSELVTFDERTASLPGTLLLTSKHQQ
jgi:Predicted nucleic-acid-binding protein, contains PIN domain